MGTCLICSFLPLLFVSSCLAYDVDIKRYYLTCASVFFCFFTRKLYSTHPKVKKVHLKDNARLQIFCFSLAYLRDDYPQLKPVYS